MNNYFIKSFEVKNLWGSKNLKIDFKKDVNIIIGPNASGKTTILDLLRYVLTVDIQQIIKYNFDCINIQLMEFEEGNIFIVKVTTKKQGFDYEIQGKKINVSLSDIYKYHAPSSLRRRMIKERASEIKELIKGVINGVWLPVSRRLPISEIDEEEKLGIESVDVCLEELIDKLSIYRLQLDSQLSNLYKQFQQQVFGIILYNKKYDQLSLFPTKPPTQHEKDQLISAFKTVGLLDTQTRIRIDQHFKEAKRAIKKINIADEERSGLIIDDLFIVPLIGRTKAMVESSRELRLNIDKLFAPLKQYEIIINSFLDKKNASVNNKGELEIYLKIHRDRKLNLHTLSSGEKQIVILLTQALLWESKSAVYIVDEPELSLHVTWQEKLLESLIELGNQLQIIVATHSPDIIGIFRDKVIDLAKL